MSEPAPVGEIQTFANCPYRTEEILSNTGWKGIIIKCDVTTDPGILDFSKCGYDEHNPSACQSCLADGTCPMHFGY